MKRNCFLLLGATVSLAGFAAGPASAQSQSQNQREAAAAAALPLVPPGRFQTLNMPRPSLTANYYNLVRNREPGRIPSPFTGRNLATPNRNQNTRLANSGQGGGFVNQTGYFHPMGSRLSPRRVGRGPQRPVSPYYRNSLSPLAR